MSDGSPIVTTVVFAAGAGDRFGGPKQFADLGGERLVDRVVRTATTVCDHVVVVVPEGHHWDGPTVSGSCVGGDSHAASVRNGMAIVPSGTDIVVLATASHPLASAALYRRVIDRVRNGADAATPRGHLPDALKRFSGTDIVETVDKSELAAAQAPSAFAIRPLKRALAHQRDVPEELQLIEEAGGSVCFVDGEDTNLHITSPLELEMARRIADLVPDP